MQDLYEGWGAAVREERRSLKMTREALAEMVEVDTSTISRIERGKICANDALKFRIAGALGVRVDHLWAWPRIVPGIGRAS